MCMLQLYDPVLITVTPRNSTRQLGNTQMFICRVDAYSIYTKGSS